MSKAENEKIRLKDEFDLIQAENNNDFNIANHLAKPEDLPDLGEIELYDYDSDITVSVNQSMDVLESLVDLYLDDVPQLKEHPYIKNKMKELGIEALEVVSELREVFDTLFKAKHGL